MVHFDTTHPSGLIPSILVPPTGSGQLPRSPNTQLLLPSRELIANIALRQAIGSVGDARRAWRDEQREAQAGCRFSNMNMCTSILILERAKVSKYRLYRRQFLRLRV